LRGQEKKLEDCVSGHIFICRPDFVISICQTTVRSCFLSFALYLLQAAALQLRKEENVQQSEKIINELESQIESLEQVLSDADARTFVCSFSVEFYISIILSVFSSPSQCSHNI
jgi:hypothetical protein